MVTPLARRAISSDPRRRRRTAEHIDLLQTERRSPNWPSRSDLAARSGSRDRSPYASTNPGAVGPTEQDRARTGTQPVRGGQRRARRRTNWPAG
jgi:hypothetical protein